ncbi:MAG: aldolase/citrate lyase family protein [bacterium]|nr:aldolase/citrate lyase family protein [bacterium]
MALKLMYITNNPDIARIAEAAGVDRIFIDMEYIGKDARQGGMDTVQSHHTISDVRRISEAVKTAEVLVRVNPIHEASRDYVSSKEEIDLAIEAGADILMLPFFKTVDEVEYFIRYVNRRARVMLLLETLEAEDVVDDILKLDGIDEMFIGLNDLSLGYGKKFMFELLTDGTVETLCLKFRQKKIPYGFGGIASLGKGMLSAEYVIREHYRLGSTCVILSRSFCKVDNMTDLKEVRTVFDKELPKIRELEKECEMYSRYFWENRKEVEEKIKYICG